MAKILIQHVNPVTNGSARGLALVDRDSDAPIGQTMPQAVVADRPLHEESIEPPFRAGRSSVDCAKRCRRFSL